MKKWIFLWVGLVSIPAWASDPESSQDFFASVLAAIQSLGGLPWIGKIALIITLLVSSMKVTVLDDLVWNRLGKFQAWLAPILGLVAGILTLGAGGQISLAGIFAYISAGAGALLLHELLDTVKAIPGLGPLWISLIGVVEGALGGNPVSASNVPVPPAK